MARLRLLFLLLLLLLALQHQIGGGAALPLLLPVVAFVPFLSALLQLFSPIASAACLFVAVAAVAAASLALISGSRARVAGVRVC